MAVCCGILQFRVKMASKTKLCVPRLSQCQDFLASEIYLGYVQKGQFLAAYKTFKEENSVILTTDPKVEYPPHPHLSGLYFWRKQ